MRIRITNAGLGSHTRITNAETDEEILWIKRIDLHLDPKCEQNPTAILEVYAPYLDLIAGAEMIQVCPHCDHELDALGKIMIAREEAKKKGKEASHGDG